MILMALMACPVVYKHIESGGQVFQFPQMEFDY